mmetsp:Transcript_31888/g.58422  ORF Transcript_31888/g.58422 Transcript_31888/m.58422 type:complete len:294 (+) Transcript_31888:101-982(+)
MPSSCVGTLLGQHATSSEEHGLGEECVPHKALESPDADCHSRMAGGGRSATRSSFIRRCLYHFRKCRESSTCGDLRTLWEKHREMVDQLPDPADCGRPKYIVTDSDLSLRYGVFGDKNRLETLKFPGEKWHKCCLKKDEGGQVTGLKCQRTPVIDLQTLLQEHNGWCGVKYCTGSRNRCLQVNYKDEPNFRPDPKKCRKGIKQCPKGCPSSCHRETMRLDCINVGEEPRYGSESAGVNSSRQLETPTNSRGEALTYEVYALQAPEPVVLLGLQVAWNQATSGFSSKAKFRSFL